MQNRSKINMCIYFFKIINVMNGFLSSKQDTTDGTQDDNTAANEETAMESDITERAIRIAYSLVNTCLSQLCEC